MKCKSFVFLSLMALTLLAPPAFANLSSKDGDSASVSEDQKKKKKQKKKKDKKGSDKKALKKEEKMWKNRAKEYAKKPLSLKELVESKKEAEESATAATRELGALQAVADEKDAKIAELRDKVAQFASEVTSLRERMTSSKPAPPPSDDSRYSKGLVFRVQIGAFNRNDLSKYFQNNPNFAGELTPSGTQRISIGVFRDYWEADTFKKELRKMGVKDAWIVPFRDGQRVDIKDVVEGIPPEGS